MKRMAILIASPTVNLNGFLPKTAQGAINSIVYWNYYLKTPKLGAWIDDEEIQYRSDWNKENLIEFIQSLKGYDYIFFVYCGHGARFPKDGCENPTSEDDFEDCILLDDGHQIVRVEDIRNEIGQATHKATMLIDACRGHVWDIQESGTLLKRPLPPLNESLNEWRNKWIDEFGKYDLNEIVLVQSCSPGEKAHMTPYDCNFSVFADKVFKSIDNVPFLMNVGELYNRVAPSVNSIADNFYHEDQRSVCSHEPEQVKYPFIITNGLEIAGQLAKEP